MEFKVCDRINFLSGREILYETRTADTTVADLIDPETESYTISKTSVVLTDFIQERWQPNPPLEKLSNQSGFDRG
jgi:hypothetical protein